MIRRPEPPMTDRLLDLSVTDGRLALAAAGSWTADHAGELETLIDKAVRRARGVAAVEIRMGAVERLDTFGAWLLERLVRTLTAAGREPAVLDLPERWHDLVEEARQVNRTPLPPGCRQRFLKFNRC